MDCFFSYSQLKFLRFIENVCKVLFTLLNALNILLNFCSEKLLSNNIGNVHVHRDIHVCYHPYCCRGFSLQEETKTCTLCK